MNWEAYWNHMAQNDHPLYQTGRAPDGNEAFHRKVVQDTVMHIRTQLDLKPSDVLVDVCCGNGLLSKALSKHCKKVYAVDQSAALIDEAKKYRHADTIHYHVAPASDFADQLPEKADKVLLFFAFQYFESVNAGMRVIEELSKSVKPGGLIFLGDIPDKKALFKFYNNPVKLLRLLKDTIMNTNMMGKFWSEKELNLICEKAGLEGHYQKQPPQLLYAHYRFDYLIRT